MGADIRQEKEGLIEELAYLTRSTPEMAPELDGRILAYVASLRSKIAALTILERLVG